MFVISFFSFKALELFIDCEWILTQYLMNMPSIILINSLIYTVSHNMQLCISACMHACVWMIVCKKMHFHLTFCTTRFQVMMIPSLWTHPIINMLLIRISSNNLSLGYVTQWMIFNNNKILFLFVPFKHPAVRGDSDDDDILSVSMRSVASSSSLASEVYQRAQKRRDEFWDKKKWWSFCRQAWKRIIL